MYPSYTGRTHAPPPVEIQVAFRGRKNNGVESLQESDGGADWEATLNTDYDWAIGTRTRLRFLSQRDNSLGIHQLRLYANYAATGYMQVDDTHPYVRLDDTQYYSHGDDATDFTGRIGTGTWNTSTAGLQGEFLETALTGPTDYLGASRDLETEFCLRLVQQNVVPTGTILFQLRRRNGNPLTSYLNTPVLTVVGPLQDVFVN